MSGFLLGYVAVLPLIGRIADLRGRLPVLVGSLVVFALGSLVTAAAYDLPSMVTGRFLQGVGGGGLVPATLALVADLYPPTAVASPSAWSARSRSSAASSARCTARWCSPSPRWQAIFAINLAVGLVLAAALRPSADPSPRAARPACRAGGDGSAGLARGGCCCLTLVALVLTMLQPPALTSRLTLGLAFVPVVGESRWLAPVGIATVVLAVAFGVRCLTARRPLVDVRGGGRWHGGPTCSAPGCWRSRWPAIILAFATADPEVSVFSPAGPWLLAGSLLAAALFWLHVRRTAEPLVPQGAFAARRPGARWWSASSSAPR